ncbi:MAG: sensor histidine kinase [Gaiellaceae bacterium]
MSNRRRLWVVGAVAFLAALLVGFALVILQSQAETRHGLEDRFSLRATLAASFTSSFVDSVVRDERRLAAQRLSNRNVSDGQFLQVIEALGVQAAVLLDRDGRVLQVWPRRPELLGSYLGGSYDHLGQALRGEVGVSNIVPSAAKGTPVVAFAVPFSSAEGRRVLSGAFAIGGTPLKAYLDTAAPFASGELALVDAGGSLVLDNRPGKVATELERMDPSFVKAMAGRLRGEYLRDGETRFFARRPVDGTPWELVASVSVDALLAPVSGLTTVIPWILFGVVAAAAGVMVGLLFRLGQQRSRLTTSNKSLAGRNRSLAGSNDKLRDLDRLKDEFVALVSHELRTPLTSIIGYVKLILRGRSGPVSQEQRELLGVVERNSLRLLSLIGDLLLSAKADAGKLELESENVDLDLLAAESLASAWPSAQSHGVTLGLEIGGGVPVYGDRARLVQLLDNLISNAINFTLEGGRVDVRVAPNGSVATIEVADTGIGIPAEEQGRLFERFFRASTATTREIQGSGLGLSVVRTIAELHRGTVEFSSVEGEGTMFRVELPLAQPDQAAAA